MKLRNKKTGQIGRMIVCGDSYMVVDANDESLLLTEYLYLKHLMEDWEDYEEPKEFWFVDSGGEVEEATYLTDNDKSSLRSFGNYFETKEEAEKAVEKLKAWKRLKDKGFTIRQWRHTPDMNLTTGSFINIKGFIPEVIKNIKDLDLLFGSEE